jgi:hypothetical protein
LPPVSLTGMAISATDPDGAPPAAMKDTSRRTGLGRWPSRLTRPPGRR